MTIVPQELKEAIDRTHFLIGEFRQDGIWEPAIIAALMQALAETVTNFSRDREYLDGVATHFQTMIRNRTGER